MSEAVRNDAGSTSSRAGAAWVPWGFVGLAVSVLFIVLGNTSLEEGENGGTGPLIVTLILCVLVAIALFQFLVPGSTNPARTGLIIGILGFVSLLAFWSGLPGVLGGAAIALGLRARDDVKGKVAIGLGAVCLVLELIAALSNI